MATFPWECILYPIPILMVACGLKSTSTIGKFIGVTGAFLWYFCLGMDGTYIAVLSLIGWTILFYMLKAVFTPRGW